MAFFSRGLTAQQTGDESSLANTESSLTELLRVPSLRSVALNYFYFTAALCRATANALMEGSVWPSLISCATNAHFLR
jgi:hypothetical protein